MKQLTSIVIDTRSSLTSAAYRLIRAASYIVLGALITIMIQLIISVTMSPRIVTDEDLVALFEGPILGLVAAYFMLIALLGMVRKAHAGYLEKKADAVVSLLRRSGGAAPLSKLQPLVPELSSSDIYQVVDTLSAINAVLLALRKDAYIQLRRHMITGEYYIALRARGSREDVAIQGAAAPPPPPPPGSEEGETRVFEPDVEH